MSLRLPSLHRFEPAASRPRTRVVVAAAAAILLLGGTVAAAADAPALWAKHCASCHGKDGKAQTKTGEKLKVRDLTDPAVMATLNKENVTASMTKGVKASDGDKLVMKAYNDKLSAEEIQALTDYTLAIK
ncbi:MAG: cytochrome c [Candidatus Binatia bacterium]